MRGAWLVVIFALGICAYRPGEFLLNGDEYFYAGQATTLTHGRFVPEDGDGLAVPVLSAGKAVKYPPAWPLLLAVGRVFSVRSMWLVTLIVHLAGGVAFARMLVRRGVPSWACGVWVFHPVAWLYARTVMSDAPAAALLLVALDAWENGDRWTMATVLAISSAMRVAGALAVAGIALVVFPEARRRRLDAAAAMAGAGAGMALMLLATQRLTGHWLTSNYAGSGGAGLIGPQMMLENGLLYAAGLTLLPPFPLAWLAMAPRRVGRWAIAAIPACLFLIAYGYHDAGANHLETLIGGQRLLLPAIALLVVATAEVWSANRWLGRALTVGAAGAAIVVTFAMGRLEDRFRPAVRAVAACRPRTIAYNLEAGRVALAVNADKYYAVDATRAPNVQADVFVIARRYRSNRAGATSDVDARFSSLRGRCSTVGDYDIVDVSGNCPESGERCKP